MPRSITISRRLLIALLLLQVVTLALLVAVCRHYRVIPKAMRALVAEERIPFVSEEFRMNRNYDPQRQIFRLYPAGGARGYLLGDSQAALVCWAELMPGAGIVGRGIAGDTAEGVLHRIEDLAGSRPQWLGLLVGTNDVLRGKNPADIAEAIILCVERLRQEHPDAVIAVVSIPPVARWVERAEARNANIAAANRIVSKGVERLSNVRWIDLGAHLQDDSGHLRDTMTTDGVHLSAAAYHRLRDLIGSTLPAVPDDR